MNVLIACEESQRVCVAFRSRRHTAYSCDLKNAGGGHPEWHIRGDVITLINGRCKFTTQDGHEHEIPGQWDMIIAHPPCTYMSRAGARFMYLTAGNVNKERLEKALQAREFFMKFVNADCEKICVENPTPLKIVGLPKESQVIQPYQFGHPYSKRTLLWLRGLPKLKPTDILTEYTPYLPSNTGGFSRGKGGSRGVVHNANEASKTFIGIARAMAEQWGKDNT